MTGEMRDLPLFPLNSVLFPALPLPLHIFEERYKLMIGTCTASDQLFGVCLIKEGVEVGGRPSRSRSARSRGSPRSSGCLMAE